MSALMGSASDAAIALTAANVSSVTSTPFGATCSACVNANGTFTLVDDAATTRPNWCVPVALANLYEAMAVYVSGSVPSGSAQGVWLSLGVTDRIWTAFKGGGSTGFTNCVFRIDIRKIGTATVLASAQYNILAQVI